MPRFSRVLGLTVGVILAFLLALISAAPASATTTSASGSDTYLALGDSVPFGYDPLVSPPVTPDDGCPVHPEHEGVQCQLPG